MFTDDSVLLAGGNSDSMELFTPLDQKFTLDLFFRMFSRLSSRAQSKSDANCYRQDCFRRFHTIFTLLPYEKAVQRFGITLS